VVAYIVAHDWQFVFDKFRMYHSSAIIVKYPQTIFTPVLKISGYFQIAIFIVKSVEAVRLRFLYIAIPHDFSRLIPCGNASVGAVAFHFLLTIFVVGSEMLGIRALRKKKKQEDRKSHQGRFLDKYIF